MKQEIKNIIETIKELRLKQEEFNKQIAKEIDELKESLPELLNDLVGKWFIIKGHETGYNDDHFLYSDVIKIKQINSVYDRGGKHLVLDLDLYYHLIQNFVEEDDEGFTVQYDDLIPVSEDFANGLMTFFEVNNKIQKSYKKTFAEIIKNEIEK